MTDNFEDLEQHQHDMEHAEEPAAKAGLRSNLAEAWRTRPLFKLLVVMTVAGAAIAAGASFFSGGQPEPLSRLANPPDIHQPPGGQASPYFRQQVKEADEQRTKEALERGTSAMPTPLGQDSSLNPAERNDPLSELKAETTRLKKQLDLVQQQQAQPAQNPNQQPERFDESLAQAMQQQLHLLMDSWVPHGIKEVVVAANEEKEKDKDKDKNLTTAAASANNALNAAPKVVVPAGTISYAQLLVEANSDVPGPILAQIVSGPLSGGRAIGSFQIANGYNDYLVLHFSHANLKGKDYTIDAYALDPDTTLGGMATEVDQRYFTRVILPAAAGFLQGLGSALGQVNSTTTATNGLAIVSQPSVGINQGLAQGMGQAAGVASSFFQNQANQTKPLVRVAAGTPMGMFFVNSVVDQTNQPQFPGTLVAGQPGYPGYPGYPGAPAGYPTSPAFGMAGMNPLMGGYPGATSVGYSGYPTSPGNAAGVPYPNVGGSSTVNGYGGGYGGSSYGSPMGTRMYPSTPGMYP